MMFDYKYVPIRWCSPLRSASSNGYTLNFVGECTLCISVTKSYMCIDTNSFTIRVVIHVKFYSFAGKYTLVVFFRPMPIRAAVSTMA